jgi:hypothetical protein
MSYSDITIRVVEKHMGICCSGLVVMPPLFKEVSGVQIPAAACYIRSAVIFFSRIFLWAVTLRYLRH